MGYIPPMARGKGSDQRGNGALCGFGRKGVCLEAGVVFEWGRRFFGTVEGGMLFSGWIAEREGEFWILREREPGREEEEEMMDDFFWSDSGLGLERQIDKTKE